MLRELLALLFLLHQVLAVVLHLFAHLRNFVLEDADFLVVVEVGLGAEVPRRLVAAFRFHLALVEDLAVRGFALGEFRLRVFDGFFEAKFVQAFWFFRGSLLASPIFDGFIYFLFDKVDFLFVRVGVAVLVFEGGLVVRVRLGDALVVLDLLLLGDVLLDFVFEVEDLFLQVVQVAVVVEHGLALDGGIADAAVRIVAEGPDAGLVADWLVVAKRVGFVKELRVVRAQLLQFLVEQAVEEVELVLGNRAVAILHEGTVILNFKIYTAQGAGS